MSHIVILHHDPIQLHFLGVLLKQDHEVIDCYTEWEEGRSFLQDCSDVDGMVIDLHMADRQSRECDSVLGLSGSDSLFSTPVLGLSRYSMESSMLQFQESFNIQACLTLPVDPQDFRRCVRQLIHEHRESGVLQV